MPVSHADEGAGIFRPTYIIASSKTRIADDGVASPVYLTGEVHSRSTPAQGLTVDVATVAAAVTLENANPLGSGTLVLTAGFQLYAADGVTLVGVSSRASANVTAGHTVMVAPPPFNIQTAELWSMPRPYLHVLVTYVYGADGSILDSVNTSIGLRSLRWDAEAGLHINDQHVKLRGFCNHASFAGVGMAVPARINLLRLQQLRGVGGNAWRMSRKFVPASSYAFPQKYCSCQREFA